MPYPNEAELAPMPTLGENEFLKLFESKLKDDFERDVNEWLISDNLEQICTFEDYVNATYIMYLEDAIGNIYSTVN
jgi:hypothetical protein